MGNLAKRSLSALVLAPVVVAAIMVGGWFFNALVVLASCILIYEAMRMTAPSPQRVVWWGCSIAYVLAFMMSIMWLRDQEPQGLWYVLWVLLVVWATDIGAYAFGRWIGGPKIAPKISPNKTWAGLLGGMGCAALCAAFFHFGNADVFPRWVVAAGALFAIISQAGDFLESGVKRRFGVKDSGSIIPGHGGVFDRLDGMVMAVPFWAALVWVAL